jgi:hypothetical protein
MVRNRESGYALLLVFLMAALLAIALYSEIPRVAFQSQRQKEQLLMTRGLQYIRGIQMFRQAFPAQPLTRMEDLETFQSRHFVRHKYVDPMTGKAEWRLIHMQNGVLIDSLVTKPPDTNNGQQPAQNYFITPTTGVGGVDPQGQGQPAARPRRPSESPGAAGGAGGGQLPPIPPPVSDGGTPPGNTDPTKTGDQSSGTNSPNPPNPTPQPIPPAPPGPGPQPSPPTPIPGNNPALSMINQLITQPRQGPAGAAAAIGATNGIVGIASKAELEGIMVYNDRTAYNEWEFIFNPTMVQMIPGSGSGPGTNSSMGPGAGQTGQPSIMQGQPGGGNVAAGMQSMFGNGGPGQGRQSPLTGAPGTQNTGAAAGGGFPPGYRPGRP